ncbi:putative 2-aminoethylphosphonate ABC transporter substrate-binding protein [Massilia glaciei]|uniref:Putative 2-aminoethylphosphonate ABC transporter substrate-binding protein n=1 Tax=Massilia glaciei TaxID=1524097 RepID=A0A2U2HMZ8_9BURK|nr:putative 2-aminoethylphosphonate ABC transporter substrate-binding protein [Massilia glaciei]
MNKTRFSMGKIGMLTAGLFAAGAGMAQAKSTLTVFTTIEPEVMKFYKTGFEKANPDIEIKWVRESAGVITNRLLADKGGADVVAGLAATSLSLLAQRNMLLAYEPKGFKQLNKAYSDQARPPTWTGNNVWGSTICFNNERGGALKLPKPKSWKDLHNPAYKGQIVMPHPVSSGTGFLDVSAWLQLWGEAEGWKYMDALHENVAFYTHSGSAPCKLAGEGKVAVGISFDFRAGLEIRSGKPITAIFPSEGLGWDVGANAIPKNSSNIAGAKKLVDWMASKEANAIYGNFYAIVAYPGQVRKMDGIPANYETLLIKKNDFNWAAKNRERILAEWSKRYGAKSEPK